MTNWFLYRIRDNLLEVLFNEHFTSVVNLQCISEIDLQTFRDMNIERAQIAMLRRLVQCLNCKQHPPVYPRARESCSSVGAGNHPVTSAASTVQSTAVGHTHVTNPSEVQICSKNSAYGAVPSRGNLEKSC